MDWTSPYSTAGFKLYGWRRKNINFIKTVSNFGGRVNIVRPGFKLSKWGKKCFKLYCSTICAKRVSTKAKNLSGFEKRKEANLVLQVQLTLNKTFPSWEKKYLLLQQQKANTFDKIIGLSAKDNIFSSATWVQYNFLWNWINCPTNGWTQLISDRLNESRPKISLSGI